MNSKNSLSVFFPAFNDQETIGSLVEDTLDVLPVLTDDFEILVINDGSRDNTKVLLDDLAQKHSCLKVIHHETNKGYGAALQSGFANAGKELIFYTDGDGQYDVKELVGLYSLMTDEVDVVNGYKIRRADRLYRIVTGELYNRAARLFFRIPIRDVDCDFRLLRRTTLRQFDLKSSSGVICVELVRKLSACGAVFVEQPVNHYPRLNGHSQFFTAGRVSRTIFDFFKLWIKLVVLQKLSREIFGSSSEIKS